MYLDHKNKNKNKKTWETKRGGSLLHYSVDMLIIILLEVFFLFFSFFWTIRRLADIDSSYSTNYPFFFGLSE